MSLVRPNCILIPAGVWAVCWAAGCNRPPFSTHEPTASGTRVEALAAKVVHPQKKTVRRSIERPGYNVEPFERTALYAKVAGFVHKWYFDLGDSVRQNDILAELYVPEMDVELLQKEAAVRQAVAEVKLAEAAVQRSRAEQRHAEAQYARLARIGRSGTLDKEQVDEARLGSEAAAAALAKAEADVEVARARHKAAEADRDRVQTLLQYTKIRAPYDGVVTQRAVNTGDFVQPAAGKSEALFVVEKIKPVRVFVNLPEMEAVWVRDGDAARIRVQSLQGREFTGRVTRGSRSLNAQNRTLRTEIDLPNADGKLLPGMFVHVTVVAAHADVWALPAGAVATQGEQSYCYRVEEGKAVKTPVRVGLRGAELVEVVQKQTKPGGAGEAGWEDWTGDEVIFAGDPATIADGQVVKVFEETSP